MKDLTFNIEVTVPAQRVLDLLSCALEGGSNYWYFNPKPLLRTSERKNYSDRFYENLYVHGFTIKDAIESKEYVIIPEKFDDVLCLMKDKYPEQFNDFVTDQMDRETGDIFLQLLVFGKVKYG